MRRKEKEKEEQLALANALSRIVLTSADIIEMGRGFVFELKQLMPISWVTIGLIEESKDLLHFFTLLPKLSTDQEPGESTPLDDTPAAWLAQNRKALLEPDLLIESRFWTGDYWLKKELRTIVYMPLFSGGAVFGSLIFASTHPHAYDERELRLLKYATSQLAAPIRYSRLFTHIIEGKQDSPISDEWMTRTEQMLRELTEAVSEYALHLKSHTASIQGLSEASQELKHSAAEQNRVLADLVKAITQAPSQTEPATAREPEPAPPPEKSIHPPGCYHGYQKSARKDTLAEKQRKLLDKRGARSERNSGPARSDRRRDKDGTEIPSRPPRYKRR